jgi:hypothetical protein
MAKKSNKKIVDILNIDRAYELAAIMRAWRVRPSPMSSKSPPWTR